MADCESIDFRKYRLWQIAKVYRDAIGAKTRSVATAAKVTIHARYALNFTEMKWN